MLLYFLNDISGHLIVDRDVCQVDFVMGTRFFSVDSGHTPLHSFAQPVS
jgi:hypothetical protein